jgi:ElaA protein
MIPITWTAIEFDRLSVHELHALLKLRTDVFVVEQQCPYPELDGRDPEALHMLGRTSNGALAAYARILPPDEHGMPHIGRVVVDPAHRGKQLGRAVMEACLRELERIHGARRSAVSAQQHLQRFYASLGYVAVSAPYVWDGIPHIDMELNVPG